MSEPEATSRSRRRGEGQGRRVACEARLAMYGLGGWNARLPSGPPFRGPDKEARRK